MGDERGAVLVVVAVAMLGFVLVVASVVDVANWFQHHRHLQLQADAGALAGATKFNDCISLSAASANADIVAAAHQYAGDPTASSPYNSQVSGDANVIVRVNQASYSGSGTDGSPCSDGYVDVKATDSNLPWFMFPGVVPAINTHARVSSLQLKTLDGSLPMAVEDVNPLAAGAIVVDEDASNFKTNSSAVLGTQALTAGSAQTLNGQSVIPWTGGPLSISIPSGHADIGVVIAMCSNKALCGPGRGNGWLTSGAVSTVCAQLFVTCVSNDSSGALFIHGYSTSGTGSASAPLLRDLTLTRGACTDDSAPYYMLNGGCRVGVNAKLDFGVTGDPTSPSSAGGVKATVSMGSCSLGWTGTTGTTSSWTASSCQAIASGAGEVPLNLSWTTQIGTGSSKTNFNGSFSQVARPYSNDGVGGTFFNNNAYPLAYALLSQGSTCTGAGANSLTYGSHSICFGIGVIGNLQNAADSSDPTKVLKFIGGTHTGAINCNGQPGANGLRDGIEKGCTTQVQRNPGEPCPNTYPTPPVDCLPIETGGKVGPTRQGMNTRFHPGSTCPVNRWTATSGPLPTIPEGDPRLVPLIITLYGAFGGSGSGYVPVMDFGEFYVTGWDGAPSDCAGINEAAPPGAGSGTIWGHFVKYVGSFPTSTGGSACDFSVTTLSPCITVMTK